MKRTVGILLLVVMLLSFCSCGSDKPKKYIEPKEFSSKGITITLTSEFKETWKEDITLALETEDILVCLRKLAFSSIKNGEDMTLYKFANLVRQNNLEKKPTIIQEIDGLTTFECTFPDDMNRDCKYFCVVYKASRVFWFVQFITLESDYDQYDDLFVKWAKSVTLDT